MDTIDNHGKEGVSDSGDNSGEKVTLMLKVVVVGILTVMMDFIMVGMLG